jgi:hypothetical protein
MKKKKSQVALGNMNNSPTQPQKELFLDRVGHDLPSWITTIEGASWAIRTALSSGLTKPMDDLVLPPECSCTKWDPTKRSGQGYGVPLSGVSSGNLDLQGNITGGGTIGDDKKEEPVEEPKVVFVYKDAGNFPTPADGFVPSITEAELVNYVSRPELDDQLAMCIDECRKGSRTMWPLLLGSPGTGKDTMLRFHAAKREGAYHVQSYDANSSMETILGRLDLKGDGHGGTNSQFTEGEWLLSLARPGILVNSEVNFAPPGKLGKLQSTLSERQLFVEEANKMYRVSDECVLAINANPARCKKGVPNHGTNPTPPAINNRCWMIRVPAWTKEELSKMKNISGSKHFDKTAELYVEIHRSIDDEGLRGVMSLRNMQRIVTALDAGFPVNTAIHGAIAEHFQDDGGEKAYKTVISLAKHIWGPEVLDMISPNPEDKPF